MPDAKSKAQITSVLYLWQNAVMKFSIRILSTKKNLLRVKFTFTASSEITFLRIPYWRPGRYEGGKFPKNYIGLTATAEGMQVASRKHDGYTYRVETPKGSEITAEYTLYAAELTAGNTYCDEEVLLLNPVNSLMWPEGREEDPFDLDLELPEEWDCATTFQNRQPAVDAQMFRFQAKNLQELLDTPILAAPDLHSYSYHAGGIPFHIHVSGYFPEDSGGIIADFKAFTEVQLQAFGGFPAEEYRFLLLFLEAKARHGVEHEKSTVIVMGPSAHLESKDMYNSFLSIASHELYHTWNVKYLRPADWTPYDFTGPSPSRLGYVAEGVTTYMGDLMLWQSGVFSDDEFLGALSGHLQRHMENEGRNNLSLADSSVDTWIDGYERTAPGRRQSIYTEGAMLAFVCDAMILDYSEGERGLSDVMRELYESCDPDKGYTEEEYWNALKAAADKPWDALYNAVADGRGALEHFFTEALTLAGLKLHVSEQTKEKETWWGTASVKTPRGLLVNYVARESPAEKCGLREGDVIETVNGVPSAEFRANTTESVMRHSSVMLEVRKGYKTRTCELQPDGKAHLVSYKIEANPSGKADIFRAWKNTFKKK